MDFVKIDGRVFDVIVIEIEEDYNILYGEDTGRTIGVGARMFLSPLGTFYGHKVTFARKSGHEKEYDSLFDTVSKPRSEGLPVEIVHGQTTIEYEAYCSNGSRKVKRIRGDVVEWDRMQVNFIPMEAQVEPE
jgi:hypothetical protein